MKRTNLIKNVVPVLLVFLLTFCSKSDEPDLELIPVQLDDKWGYINFAGELLINPQFSYATLFSDDVALVRTSDNNYGYINKEGKYLLSPNYKSATIFSEGMACVVTENSKPAYINTKGETIFSVDADIAIVFKDAMAAIKVKDKWGFINREGKVVITPQFDEVGYFSEGLAPIKMKDQFGYIDKTGKIVINPQFVEAKEFIDGLAIVKSGKSYGFINKEGKYIINPQFDFADNFTESRASFRQGSLYGFIDKDGKIEINPQFNQVTKFSKGVAVVYNGTNWGFIEKDGKYSVNPQFEWASQIFGNYCFVKSGGKVGIVDKKGKFLVNPQFNNVNLNKNQFQGVESDFFDIQSVVNFFTNLVSANTIHGFSLNTKLKIVLEKFQDVTVDNFGLNDISLKNVTPPNNETSVSNYRIKFSTNTYNSERQYENYIDYWGRSQQRFTGSTKVINYDAEIFGFQIAITLRGKGSGKGNLIAQDIKNYLSTNVNAEVEELSLDESSGHYTAKINKLGYSCYYSPREVTLYCSVIANN